MGCRRRFGVLTHIDGAALPTYVDITAKAATQREAVAECSLWLPSPIWSVFSPLAGAAGGGKAGDADEVAAAPAARSAVAILMTAILAGVNGAKQTSALIPLCHNIPLEKCKIHVSCGGDSAWRTAADVAGAATPALPARCRPALQWRVHSPPAGANHPLPPHLPAAVEPGGGHLTLTCTAATTGKTGVEMEALTGCTLAALTVYDMTKGLSSAAVIGGARLVSKTGGKADYSVHHHPPVPPAAAAAAAS